MSFMNDVFYSLNIINIQVAYVGPDLLAYSRLMCQLARPESYTALSVY